MKSLHAVDRDPARHLHHTPGEGRTKRTSATTSPGSPFDELDAELRGMGLTWIAGHYGNGIYSIVLTLKAQGKHWQKAYGAGTTLIEAFQDAIKHAKQKE